MKEELKTGDHVVKLGSKSDYTTGRTGVITEISGFIPRDMRAKILWDGSHPRTWVKLSSLKKSNP